MKSELAVQFHPDVAEEEKSHFFGRFCANPENFKFNLGERRLIDIFGKHLRDLATKPDGLNHFKVKDVNIKKHDRNRIQFVDNDLIQTSIGVVFRKLPAATDGFDGAVNVSKILPKIDDIKKSLFIKVNEHYANFEDSLKKSEFNEDSAIVTMKNNRLDASVLCIFCAPSEKRDVKVFCRRMDGIKSQWVLSNLSIHEDRCHQIGIGQKVNMKPKKKIKEEPHDDIVDGKKKLRNIPKFPDKKKTTISDDSSMDFDALNANSAGLSSDGIINIEMTEFENTVDTENEAPGNIATGSTQAISTTQIKAPSKNVALDMDMKRYQDILYTSVYSQMIRMENCVSMHKEDTKEFIIGKIPRKKSKVLVKVVEIREDGNCLFYALSQQLFYLKTNSVDHIESARNLRKKVVEHVCENIDLFSHGLKDRLIENRLEWRDDLRGNCLKFVKEILSEDGSWGGEETLRATAAIFQVNILLILDRETCVLGNRFNPSYERALVLSYVSSNNQAKQMDHYESVCEISEDSMVNYVTKVMELEKSSVIFHNEILNCNNFIIQ